MARESIPPPALLAAVSSTPTTPLSITSSIGSAANTVAFFRGFFRLLSVVSVSTSYKDCRNTLKAEEPKRTCLTAVTLA